MDVTPSASCWKRIARLQTFGYVKSGIVVQCRQVHVVNAITRTRKAESANYPFCTIDPNVGVVTYPDARLQPLAEIAKTQTIIPTSFVVDIAGLVKGAAQGEGLGNKFLSHIREVDAIIQVIRCFEDEDIHHVAGTIDPIRDIETILTELVMADLESFQKAWTVEPRMPSEAIRMPRQNTMCWRKSCSYRRRQTTLTLNSAKVSVLKPFFLLTAKPTIFAANVKEDQLAEADQNPYVEKVRQYATDHHACDTVIISAQIESDLVDLAPEEAADFLKEMGVEESGVGSMIRQTYHLLGLQGNETWTIQQGDTAPQQRGHSHRF